MLPVSAQGNRPAGSGVASSTNKPVADSTSVHAGRGSKAPHFVFPPALNAQQRAIAREANAKKHDRLSFAGPPDTSMWYRYMDAGYNAEAKGSQELAKKYYLASLSELEKKPPATKELMTVVKINTLERLLRQSYPKDWSTYDNWSVQTLKLHKEQMETLERIVKLNQRCIPPGDTMISKYLERYQLAKNDYEKCLQAQGQQPALKEQ